MSLTFDQLRAANKPHPTGIDLGEATREKFNEVSDRVRCDVKL